MRLILERGVIDGAPLLDEIVSRAPWVDGLKRPEQLHLTCLYMGEPEKLAEEIARRAGSPARTAARHLAVFVETSLKAYSSIREEAIVGLDTLGSAAAPVTAALVEPSSPLLQERKDLWSGLMAVIRRAGVEEPEEFALTSSVLRLPSPVWAPHVTVATGRKLDRAQTFARLPVTLGPLRLHT